MATIATLVEWPSPLAYAAAGRISLSKAEDDVLRVFIVDVLVSSLSPCDYVPRHPSKVPYTRPTHSYEHCCCSGTVC